MTASGELGKVVFLGAGQMAEALVRGLLRRGICPAAQIVATDVRDERLDFFRRTLGVSVERDNARAVPGADLVVVAVKPQDLRTALGQARGGLDRRATSVLSIAAGVRTDTIEEALGAGARVMRAMPNTPALVGEGVAALCGGRWVGEEDLRKAEAVLGAVGLVVRVREDDMDAVTAVSGSGPAYVFFLMEALEEAARRFGLPGDIARRLIVGTVVGAGRLCQETGQDPAELRERVTSKGGTTAAALEVLRARGVFEAWVEAVAAARRRAQELSRS